MYIEVFIVGLLAAASPGPDFAVVMRNSLCYGRTKGFATALGIGSALIIHILYTLLGFALIIKSNPMIFKSIQILGALYLLWLGYHSFTAKSNNNRINYERKSTSQNMKDKTFYKGYRDGFLCNSLNPKATLFFLGIFSQFLTSTTPLWVQTIYGLEIILAVSSWFIILSSIISLHNFRNHYLKYDIWVNKLLGCFLSYIGLKIIFSAI